MQKNSRMSRADTVMRMCFVSWKRLLKKSGSVMELFATSEYLRSRRATIFQFKYVPIARPIAVHMASEAPVK